MECFGGQRQESDLCICIATFQRAEGEGCGDVSRGVIFVDRTFKIAGPDLASNSRTQALYKSGKHGFNDFTVDICESETSTLVPESESLVVDSQLMQNGCLQVVYSDAIGRHVEAKLIR